MPIDIPELESYLIELNRLTASDPGAKISMFAVGESLGLEKQRAGKLGEMLIAEGWAEVKTLSGAIGITEAGIQEVNKLDGNPAQPGPGSLGDAPVLDDTGRAAVENVLMQMKSRLQQLQLSYDQMEELVLDIKTIEVQLLSPKPKTSIVKAALHALSDAFSRADAGDTAAMIDHMTQ